MKVLTREAFLAAPKATLELVEIPGIDGAVYVRQITVGERDVFESRMQKQRRGNRSIRSQLVALVACDAEGRRLFDDEDVPLLADLPASFVEPIINAHLRINGSNQDDVNRLAEGPDRGTDGA